MTRGSRSPGMETLISPARSCRRCSCRCSQADVHVRRVVCMHVPAAGGRSHGHGWLERVDVHVDSVQGSGSLHVVAVEMHHMGRAYARPGGIPPPGSASQTGLGFDERPRPGPCRALIQWLLISASQALPAKTNVGVGAAQTFYSMSTVSPHAGASSPGRVGPARTECDVFLKRSSSSCR